MDEFLREFLSGLSNYKGRIIGGTIGFVAGLIWAYLGFWRALAFVFCVIAGYYLGKKVDKRGSLRDILAKVLPPND